MKLGQGNTGLRVRTHNVSATSPVQETKSMKIIMLEKFGESKVGQFVGISVLISDFAIELGRPCMMAVRL